VDLIEITLFGDVMDTYIYLDNYRGFFETHIPLRQVNFLVGENSTGKTSFLELLEPLFNPAFWVISPDLKTGAIGRKHFFDLVSISSKKKINFTIGIIRFDAQSPKNSTATLISYKNNDGRAEIDLFSEITEQECRSIMHQQISKGKSGEVRFKIKKVGDEVFQNAHKFTQSCVQMHENKIGFKKIPLQEKLLGMPLLLQCQHMLFPGREEDSSVDIPEFFSNNLAILAPIRTKPRRTYDEPQTTYSAEGGHTPYIIKKLLKNKRQVESFKKFLDGAGQKSGLFKSVIIREFGRGAQAPFEVDIILGEHALSIDNVGYGVSQALPVLVEMFVRAKGTVFSIQQPEVHLHPKAQATVGDFIAELARLEQKKFFVETHSDFTIDRFCLNLRQNKGMDIDSQILFFERIPMGNKVTPIAILSNGELSEELPPSYREFFLEEQMLFIS
jgi:hypothetical protein